MDELLKTKLSEYINKYYKEEDVEVSSVVYSCDSKAYGLPRRNKNLLKNEDLGPLCKIKLDLEPTFCELLFKLIDKSGLKDSEIYKKANIDRRLFSKIRSDINYSPNKNTIIQLIFGLSLEIDTALKLLNTAGYTLSFSKKSDVIVRYYLENKIYDIMDLNNTLYEYDLKTLF